MPDVTQRDVIILIVGVVLGAAGLRAFWFVRWWVRNATFNFAPLLWTLAAVGAAAIVYVIATQTGVTS
jgi:hypothetical protein